MFLGQSPYYKSKFKISYRSQKIVKNKKKIKDKQIFGISTSYIYKKQKINRKECKYSEIIS